MAKSIHSAKDAMLLLNMSMNASTIGLVVAAIAALATTTIVLTRRANEAAEAANRAKKAFNEETAGLRSLIEILNDSNLSYEARKDALEKIQKIVPAYHASLTEEGRLIDNNTAALDKYLEKRQKDITLKALYEDLDKAIAERDAYINLNKPAIIEWLEAKVGTPETAERYLEELQAAVDEKTKKISDFLSKGEDASILGPFLPEGFDKELGRIKEAGDLIKQARENVADLNNELSRVKSSPEQYQNAEKWAAAIKEAEENLKNAQETLTTLIGGESEAYKKSQEAVQKIIGERWKDLKETYDDISKYFRGEESAISGKAFSDLEDAIRSADDALSEADESTIEYAKSYDFLGQQASIVFADISELSSDMIRQIIANAQKYVNTNKDLTDEQIAEYRRAIDQANTYLVEKNPWDALKVAQERYVKSIEDYNNAQKAYDLAKQAGDGKAMKEAIEAQNSAILEQASALRVAKQAYEEINNIFNDTLSIFGEVAEVMGMDKGLASSIQSLVSAASKLATEMAKSITSIAKVGDAAADAAKKIGSGASMGGLVGAFIGLAIAIMQVASSIVDAEDAAEEEEISKFVAKVDAKVESLRRNLEALASISGIGDGWFTEDLFNNVVQASRAAKQSWVDLTNALDEVQSRWSKVYNQMYGRSSYQRGSGGERMKEFLDLIKEVQKTLSYKGLDYDAIPDYLRDGESSKGLDYSIDNLRTYINLLKDLEAQYEISGSTALAAGARELWNELEAYIEAHEKLQSSISALTGDISNSLLNTVKSVWEEFGIAGEDSIARVTAAAKESIGEIVDQMVSQQIWATTMASYFDTLGEGLVSAIESGDSGALIDVFDEFWAGMQTGLADYTHLMKAFYKTAEEHGWNITPKIGGDNTAKDSIKAMREELARLQEQWESLSAAEREGDVGKNLFGNIKDLEAKIEAAESLYDISKDIEGSINDINAQLSRLEEEWNAMSEAERKGAEGLKNREDKSFYEDLLNQAQGIQQSELEKLQALVESSEAKYNLYQKWVQLYGKDTADQMMGDMLDDAAGYVDNLRSGIAELTAKVTEGTATDEEIAQLEAWEGQLEDIMNQGAQAAINAANEASQAWNDSLNEALEGAGTQYEKMAVLQNEYLSALENYEGLDAGPMKDAAREYLDYLEGMLKDQSTLIENDLRDRYKTQEQANAETLKTFEDDIKYAREVLQDEDLAKEIERQMAEFLSGIAAAGLEASEDYKLIFGDLENISEEAFNNAMAEIRKSVEESVDLTEEAKAEILKNLDAIAAGFKKTLGDAVLEDLKKSFDDLLSYMNDTLSLLDAFGASDALKGTFKGVMQLVEGYRMLKVAQEEAALAGSAVDLTKVFSSMTTMILGLVSALRALGSSMVQIIDNSPITALAGAYDKLTDAIRRSVGEERKRNQEAARQNLIDQRNQIARELQKEKSRWGFSFTILGKKVQILGPDQGVVDALTRQLNQIDGALTDLGDTMKDDWLQTDAVSFASELSNILTSQYDSYADMMADVEALTNKTLQNITRQWLTAHFLEDSISQALDALYGGGGEPTAQAYEEF
ncbi:MAG TPA: hypothetical protein PLF16_00945, partial [Candidatus Staskawiczbacteria bacterium]|nr:hypothetical protein [Candidatus Staskawiczbacteria bacterium]